MNYICFKDRPIHETFSGPEPVNGKSPLETASGPWATVMKSSRTYQNLFALLTAVLVLSMMSGCGLFRKHRVSALPSGSLTVGQQVASQALSYVGTPYVWGGDSPKGFDCSGLAYYVYKKYGYKLPRRAVDQMSVGRSVRRRDLRPGDLVFFRISKGSVHVGIYTGDGRFVHAPKKGKSVEVQSMDNSWYRRRYYKARRVLKSG